MVVQQIRRMSPTDLQHRLANRPASPTCYLSTALDVRLLLVLLVDQGFEHGTTDFVGHPESADLDFQMRLPIEGGYSAEVTVQAA